MFKTVLGQLPPVSLKPKTPWFNEEIRQVKRRRRKAEKKWLKSKDVKDYDDYKAIRNEALSLMNQARHVYYNECINENSSDQKKLFGITKSLLCIKKSTPNVPPHIDKGIFVNELGSFFEQKIKKICDNIQAYLTDESNRIAINSSCLEGDYSCLEGNYSSFEGWVVDEYNWGF